MKPLARNQRGQAILEAVLIIVMLMGFTMMVANYFKSQEVLKKLITEPFQYVAGMLQNGVWQPPDKGAAAHPAGHYRHIVITGEAAR